MHQLVPDFILQQIAAGRESGSFPAAALFVDISGFSTLTNRLMMHGQHGAEVLASVMGSVWEPPVESVYEQGGFIATFAGDAFTALFPAPDNPASHGQAEQALAAAWSIQAVMKDVSRHDTAYGLFEVEVKVGLALGEVNWGIIVSDDQQRAVYYFRGSAVDGSARAEKMAGGGDVIIGPVFYKRVQTKITAERVGDHFLLKSIAGDLPAGQPIQRPAADLDLISRFYPRDLVTQEHPGEFRQVVSLFISLPTEGHLAIFMQTVFALQERYGGLFNQLDFGDKGTKLLLFWGAPLAYENDIERALDLVLDLQERTTVPINAGVTYQIALAGFNGCRLREEYTCQGNGINLAARLMTTAPRGEIWVDENVARLASGRFDLEFEEARLFKGFAEPQRVYALLQRKDAIETFFDGQLVGREDELRRLGAFVGPIFDGRYGGALVIWGEAGMGKSRLAYEFQTTLQDESVSWFLCQADETLRASLNPFRYWLKQYFGLSEGLSEARNKRHFNRKLDRLIAATEEESLTSDLDRTRSCLGALVGLEWPDSLYRQLDAKGRYDNTFTALISLLQAESLRQPAVLFVEDAHWLDDDSKSFLSHLTEEMATATPKSCALAILVAARPESGSRRLGDTLPGQELNLGGLRRETMATLASNQLSGPIAPSLLQLLENRAEGNPFFAEQLLRYLEESDLLKKSEFGWETKTTAGDPLPTEVRAILVARLDRLTQDLRGVVQTAAILGREFEVRTLTQMLRPEGFDVRSLVAEAEQKSIWSTLNEIRHIFKHALLRDAAYKMQIRARREALHALAVEAIERLYASDLGSHFAELAYHAERAKLREKAVTYLLLAGDAAAANFANSEAITYYDRTLEIGGRDRLAGRQLQHLYLSRGRAMEHTGDHAQVLESYEELILLADKRQDDQMKLAAIVAIGTLRSVNTSSVFDADQAKIEADRGLALARSLSDRAAESRIYWHLMHLATHTGQPGDAQRALEYGEASLALAKELDLREQMALTLNNLWLSYIGQGQTSKGLASAAEAQRLFRETANLPMLVDSYNGSAGYLQALGEFEAALAGSLEAGKIATSIGNLWNQFYAANISGIVYTEQGEYGLAVAVLESPVLLKGKSQLTGIQVYTNLFLADAFLDLGAITSAAPCCQVVVDAGPNLAFFMQQAAVGLHARYYLTLGDPRRAQRTISSLQPIKEMVSYQFTAFTLSAVITDAEVSLVLGENDRAGRIAAELLNALGNGPFRVASQAARFLMARTLLRGGDMEAAERLLALAQQETAEMGNRRILWKILATQAKIATDPAKARQRWTKAREIVTYIADHAGSPELSRSFLGMPAVQEVIQKAT